jgi:hypothetical protein
MYLAEIAEESIRGAISNLFPMMAGLGILNTLVYTTIVVHIVRVFSRNLYIFSGTFLDLLVGFG